MPLGLPKLFKVRSSMPKDRKVSCKNLEAVNSMKKLNKDTMRWEIFNKTMSISNISTIINLRLKRDIFAVLNEKIIKTQSINK